MADDQSQKGRPAEPLRDVDPKAREQPGAQGAGKAADAIDESGNLDQRKLRQNQQDLGVGPDHETADMRKSHRGTFP
jgi:hypothetical protein